MRFRLDVVPIAMVMLACSTSDEAAPTPPPVDASVAPPPIAIENSSDAGTAPSCSFDGKPVTDRVTAYQTSTVPAGASCTSQVRVCTDGLLTGSYPFASCTPGGAAACLLGDVTVPDGATVTAFATGAVPFGQACPAGTPRTCAHGVLSGTGDFASCAVGSAGDCVLAGVVIPNGTSVTRYAAAEVADNGACVSQTRACVDGTLSGSGSATACVSLPHFYAGASSHDPTILASGFHSLYSPEILGGRLYIGGALVPPSPPADIGDADALYSMALGVDTTPAPIQWSSSSPVPQSTPGHVTGYHVNDPTIVQHPSQPWQFMYATYLPNGSSPYFNPSATLANAVSDNYVGFLSTTDNGATWSDHGVVLGANNGLDLTGAWSPSAIVVGSELWLYYHTNAGCNVAGVTCTVAGGAVLGGLPPRVLRTKLPLAGYPSVPPDATTTTAIENATGGPLSLINVDVTFAEGQYWLVGGDGLQKLVLYVSHDGTRFYPFTGKTGDPTLVASAPSFVTTPFVEVTGPTTLLLSFGFTSDLGQGWSSDHRWPFDLH